MDADRFEHPGMGHVRMEPFGDWCSCPTPRLEALGQAYHEAHRQTAPGSGERLPRWEDLGPHDRWEWIEAAKAQERMKTEEAGP